MCTLAKNQKVILSNREFIPTYLDRENSAQFVLNLRTKSRNIRVRVIGPAKALFTEDLKFIPSRSSSNFSLSPFSFFFSLRNWLHFQTLSILSKGKIKVVSICIESWFFPQRTLLTGRQNTLPTNQRQKQFTQQTRSKSTRFINSSAGFRMTFRIMVTCFSVER